MGECCKWSCIAVLVDENSGNFLFFLVFKSFVVESFLSTDSLLLPFPTDRFVDIPSSETQQCFAELLLDWPKRVWCIWDASFRAP